MNLVEIEIWYTLILENLFSAEISDIMQKILYDPFKWKTAILGIYDFFQLKSCCRNFCHMSEISAQNESFNINVYHVSVSTKFINKQKSYEIL